MHKLILVEWLDSRVSDSGWQFLTDTKEPDACKVQTIGWLIKQGKNAILLAQCLSDEGEEHQQTGGRATIARCQIQKILDLSNLAGSEIELSYELEDGKAISSYQ